MNCAENSSFEFLEILILEIEFLGLAGLHGFSGFEGDDEVA